MTGQRIVAVRRSTDAEQLADPRARFPDYTRIDAADLAEAAHGPTR